MKKMCFIISIFLFTGCGSATYSKNNQLSPQAAIGWEKKNSHRYQYSCNKGEVNVGPIILGVEGAGDISLIVPIPSSKEKIRKMNDADAWCFIEFRDSNPIDYCDLSYVVLVDQGSGKQVVPIASMDIPSKGRYEGKYTHGCHYYFNIDKKASMNYLLYVSDDVFGCHIEPIIFRHEKSIDFQVRELM